MKNLASLTAVYCTLIFTACSADAAKPVATPAPTTEEQKMFYALGQLMSKSLETFELKPDEFAMVQKGLNDGISGAKTDIKSEEYGPKIQQLAQTRMMAAGERNKTEGADFVMKAAAEAGAKKTESGMVIKHTKEGTGAAPTAEDQVKVHYEGRTTKGKVFDSSIARGEPAVFPLGGVIRCWTEGLQLMKVGGKAQLVCPAEMAYGPGGHPPDIMPNSTLVFDVELLDIVKPEPPPPAPEPAPAAKPKGK